MVKSRRVRSELTRAHTDASDAALTVIVQLVESCQSSQEEKNTLSPVRRHLQGAALTPSTPRSAIPLDEAKRLAKEHAAGLRRLAAHGLASISRRLGELGLHPTSGQLSHRPLLTGLVSDAVAQGNAWTQ